MSANAFDTLKAAKSLKAAGFDEAQAEAVVATVTDAVSEQVAPLASGIAAIAANMATKDEFGTVKSDLGTVKNRLEKVESSLEFVKERVATISETMATREYVQTAIALEMKALYRHLWVMGTGFVAVTVALVKLLP